MAGIDSPVLTFDNPSFDCGSGKGDDYTKLRESCCLLSLNSLEMRDKCVVTCFAMLCHLLSKGNM